MRRALRIAAVALTAIVATCSAQGMAQQDMAGQVTGSTGELHTEAFFRSAWLVFRHIVNTVDDAMLDTSAILRADNRPYLWRLLLPIASVLI